MALDDELKKVKESSRHHPLLTRESLEEAKAFYREKIGADAYKQLEKDTDLSDPNSSISQWFNFLDDLKKKNIELCEACLIKLSRKFLDKSVSS